jgi:hypothetical protein
LPIAFSAQLTRRDRLWRWALFAIWLGLVLLLVSNHVMWRDEVRALTMALSGDNVFDMIRGVQGEGHPLTWYLLLRGAHAIVPMREVMPAIHVLIAAAAMAVLLWRSPFRLWFLALILLSRFGLLEYAVISRNYGMAMLVMFVIAWLYPRWRDRGVTIGLLLALLCNTNVASAMLAAAFLLFWLVELVGEEGVKWGPKYRLFVINAGIAAAGALLCFFTVFPTVHDAAPNPDPITIGLVTQSLLFPAMAFSDMLPGFIPASDAGAAILGMIIFLAVLGLVRRPAALLSALAAMVALELFFNIVYPGYYRHQALFLVFLIVLYWLVAVGRGGSWPTRGEGGRLNLPVWGSLGFAFLLAMQVGSGARLALLELTNVPYSRARDLAELLEREHLTNAIVIANPDYMLEPLPYYAANPTYLMRQQKFGQVTRFSRQVRTELTPDDYLRDARALQARTGRPVVILLETRLEPDSPAFRIVDLHVWYFSGTPDQIRNFLGSTRRLARFGPSIVSETYDVYLLNQGSTPPPR